MSSCCNCCGFTSLIGVVFFGITATMVQRENTVFLTHKAGMNIHDINQDEVHTKFLTMIYSSLVFLLAMTVCFTSGHFLKKREERLISEEFIIKERNAKVAFENDDSFQEAK